MTSTTTTEKTTTTQTPAVAKTAAVNALAVVGFIVLLILGITLAIYSARYIPAAITQLGGDTSNSNNSGSLSVVTSTSTSPYGNQTSLTATTTTMALTPPGSYAMTADASNAPASQTAYATPEASAPGAPAHRAPYGLSDLSVHIIATGYLAGPSTASFTSASVIPPGARPAVEFSIANAGTNVTGSWNFLAQIPSINNQVFNSPTEPSLNPGDHTVFTLGFNEAIPGPSQAITIVADPNNTISESTKTNNSATAAVTIIQTGN